MTGTEIALLTALTTIIAGGVGVWLGGVNKVSEKTCTERTRTRTEAIDQINNNIVRIGEELGAEIRELRKSVEAAREASILEDGNLHKRINELSRAFGRMEGVVRKNITTGNGNGNHG